MLRFSLQKSLPALVCVALLALGAALGTHFVLKTLYGVPAPAALAPLAAPIAVGVPAWLAGGGAAQDSSISVLGIVAQSTDGQRGLALLQTSSGDRAKVYSVGQTLPNGAVLQAVQSRSVTLNAQGQLQTLPLDLKTSAAGAAVNPQRGVAVVDALAAPAFPNPMSTGAAPLNLPALGAQTGAAQARMAAKRLRAAPLSPQGQQVESQGEPSQ